MQRRAAAMYAGLFILIAVGAYLMVGFVEEPQVTVEDPEYSLTQGDSFDVGDRTYTVGEMSGNTVEDRSTTLSWTNDSEQQTTTLGNGTTVPVAGVMWDGQTARQETTLANGSTVAFNGSEYTLVVDDGEVSLVLGNASESFAVGETLRYQANQTTVTAAGDGNATLAWGGTYNVSTQTSSNDSFALRQSFNVTAILLQDPDVQNESFTVEGEQFVRYTNGTTQPLETYLPVPENKTFSEGDTLTLDTAEEGVTYDEVTVENVTAERALFTWRGPVPREVSAGHAGNVSLGPDDRLFVAHFPDNETLELTSDYSGYQDQLDVQATYHDRVNGLWGISILSGLAAVFLIGGAYLPSRY